MALDGLFLHNLINEIKDDVIGKKIYKIIPINDTDYAFYLSNKKTFLISASPSHAHIRLSDKEFLASNAILANYFSKHLQSAIITDISQFENDRLVIISLDGIDDLGYVLKYKLYLELMGKNSNLIVTNKDDIILEAVKKSYLTDAHLIKTGIKYEALKDDKLNPYRQTDNLDPSLLQGVSKQASQEIREVGLNAFLKYEKKPVLIKNDKFIFYYTDLKTIYGERSYFNSLSELLEYYYEDIQKQTSESQDLINTKKYLNKELEKAKNKLEKQKIELENAKNNETLEKYANLLKANFYLIKPYTDKIDLIDYETQEKITIPLNPKLKASENIEAYYNKIKKNKRTIDNLGNQIKETEKQIEYYSDNITYLDYSKIGDLKEIMIELGLRKSATKKTKPHLAKYVDSDNNIYYFGKNNVQNNYLTHEFAHQGDYWFHAKSIAGSHVILVGQLNEKSIQIAANIAAYYSKARESVHVCVDYTQIKWVKKIKGELGSNVIYTHEKTAYADPSIDYINEHAKLS